jgi:hypothetical protein
MRAQSLAKHSRPNRWLSQDAKPAWPGLRSRLSVLRPRENATLSLYRHGSVRLATSNFRNAIARPRPSDHDGTKSQQGACDVCRTFARRHHPGAHAQRGIAARGAVHSARRRGYGGASPHRAHHACPYKGDASYFTVSIGDRTANNAVRCYEQAFPAAATIAGRLAFAPDRTGGIEEWPA